MAVCVFLSFFYFYLYIILVYPNFLRISVNTTSLSLPTCEAPDTWLISSIMSVLFFPRTETHELNNLIISKMVYGPGKILLLICFPLKPMFLTTIPYLSPASEYKCTLYQIPEALPLYNKHGGTRDYIPYNETTLIVSA